MRKAAFVVVGLLATLMMPLSVSASTGPNPGVPPGKHLTASDIARSSARHALAVELAQWSSGQISTSKIRSDVAAFLSRWGPTTFVSQRFAAQLAKSPDIALDPGPPGAYSLSVTQYPETNPSGYCQPGFSCYCGPAAAVSVLQFLQAKSHDGETLVTSSGDSSQGQFGLAGNFYSQQAPNPPYSYKYLETNVRGGETPWYVSSSDVPMSMTFNYWISGNYTGSPYYANYRPTSVSDYETLLKSDIWNGGAPGYPLAGDVEEKVNSVHLWGHPANLEIEHWIAMYGYAGSGYYTNYVDPVAGSPLNGNYGFNVSAYNSYFLSSDLYTLVTDAGPNGGPYGIVW